VQVLTAIIHMVNLPLVVLQVLTQLRRVRSISVHRVTAATAVLRAAVAALTAVHRVAVVRAAVRAAVAASQAIQGARVVVASPQVVRVVSLRLQAIQRVQSGV
jgi:hypothetical protein